MVEYTVPVHTIRRTQTKERRQGDDLRRTKKRRKKRNGRPRLSMYSRFVYFLFFIPPWTGDRIPHTKGVALDDGKAELWYYSCVTRSFCSNTC